MTESPTDNLTIDTPIMTGTDGFSRAGLYVTTSDGVTSTFVVNLWSIDIPVLPDYYCQSSEAVEAQERYERHLAFLAWVVSILNLDPRPSGAVFIVDAQDTGKKPRPQQLPSTYG
jgi:hypothetical protein